MTTSRRAAALSTGAVFAAIASLGLAACGSDSGDSGSGGDANADITAVVKKAITTDDPQVKCVETVTKGFVTTVYGDLATCKRVEVRKPDDAPRPESAATSAIKVSGDTATATVTVKGGETDGASGPISFAKEDGEWKVSEVSVGFLRSQLKKGLEGDSIAKVNPAFASAENRLCLQTGIDELSDETFKAFAFASISEKTPPMEVVTLFQNCTVGEPEEEETPAAEAPAAEAPAAGDEQNVEFLRKKFEEGITEAAKDNATPEQIDCILKVLRKNITDTVITDSIAKGQSTDEIQATVTEAFKDCKVKPTS